MIVRKFVPPARPNGKNWNKKAQEEVASLLVVFIVVIGFVLITLLFMLAVFSIAGSRNVADTVGNWLSIEGWKSQEKQLPIDNFFAILNSEIEFQGKNVKVVDFIELSLEDYYEIKSGQGKNLIDVFGTEREQNFATMTKPDFLLNGFSSDDWDKIIELREREREVSQEIVRVLEKYCDVFVLEIPQGAIGEKGWDVYGKTSLVNTAKASRLDWTKDAVYEFNYKGTDMEVRYRQLQDCLEWNK